MPFSAISPANDYEIIAALALVLFLFTRPRAKTVKSLQSVGYLLFLIGATESLWGRKAAELLDRPSSEMQYYGAVAAVAAALVLIVAMVRPSKPIGWLRVIKEWRQKHKRTQAAS